MGVHPTASRFWERLEGARRQSRLHDSLCTGPISKTTTQHPLSFLLAAQQATQQQPSHLPEVRRHWGLEVALCMLTKHGLWPCSWAMHGPRLGHAWHARATHGTAPCLPSMGQQASVSWGCSAPCAWCRERGREIKLHGVYCILHASRADSVIP
jgi:hypothetical protein